MKKKNIIFAIVVMIIMLIEPEITKTGASEGVDLCMSVIIPSLFPLFIVSTYLNASLGSIQLPHIHILRDYLKIPKGGESLLLVGLIGGYPVGAQVITDAYKKGQLSKSTAQIMLGYCSNAGPAFIFGVTGSLFTSSWMPAVLWGIHIISAFIAGCLLPKPDQNEIHLPDNLKMSLSLCIKKSIITCSYVSAWIIIFRILLVFIYHYIPAFMSNNMMKCLLGVLELSNGCIQLGQIPWEAVRFVICTAYLSFGGMCIILQTKTITDDLSLGLYLPGKILQTLISVFAALILAPILFEKVEFNRYIIGLCVFMIPVLVALTCFYTKKVWKFCYS